MVMEDVAEIEERRQNWEVRVAYENAEPAAVRQSDTCGLPGPCSEINDESRPKVHLNFDPYAIASFFPSAGVRRLAVRDVLS